MTEMEDFYEMICNGVERRLVVQAVIRLFEYLRWSDDVYGPKLSSDHIFTEVYGFSSYNYACIIDSIIDTLMDL